MSHIFGVRIDHLASEARLRDLCLRWLDGDRAVRIFTPNPEILLHARADPTYAAVLRTADLALPDGTGVAMIESLRAGRRIRRWPGVEIGELLVRIAAERDASVAFVGGGDGVARRAAERWIRTLPGLRIAVAGAGVAISEDGVVDPAENDPALRVRSRPARRRSSSWGSAHRSRNDGSRATPTPFRPLGSSSAWAARSTCGRTSSAAHLPRSGGSGSNGPGGWRWSPGGCRG